MDYSNQTSIFNPENYKNVSISIIGIGAIGGITTTLLSKMGISSLSVYDDDTLEDHNFPNQFYKLNQIGNKKTDAIKEIVSEFTDNTISCNGNIEKGDTIITPIAIVVTDSMESRKIAYEASKEFVEFFIDGRMNGNTYRVYTVNMKNELHRKEYEDTLYSDETSDEGLCTEKSIIYNVAEIGSKICNQVKKVLNKEPYVNMIAYDFINYIHLIKRWEEKNDK